MNYITDPDTRSGTLGGTMLVILLNINVNELFSAIVLAATGAVVSFLISVLCKYVWRRMIKKTDPGRSIQDD